MITIEIHEKMKLYTAKKRIEEDIKSNNKMKEIVKFQRNLWTIPFRSIQSFQKKKTSILKMSKIYFSSNVFYDNRKSSSQKIHIFDENAKKVIIN